MGRNKSKAFISVEDILDFCNHLMAEKPCLRLFIPLILLFWAIERWVFSVSNWVPLVVAVCATIQYGNYQRQILTEDLNKKWKLFIRNTSPITPVEHCQWLNKLLMEIWQNYLNPKFSLRFRYIVERRLKHRKSRLIEKIELQEFSLGSIPASLGLNGTCWSASGDQRVLRLGFDWDTNEISIMLLVKMAKPLIGTARVVINSLHIKGDLLLTPILDGKAILYSFLSTPEVRLGVAFGSGGSDSLPATELPGVSSWLVKLLTDTLVRTMVEPHRSCLSLPAVDLRKNAIGGVLYVTVISASKLCRSSLRERSLKGHLSSSANGVEKFSDDRDLHTFVEVELGELTRRTDLRSGPIPQWDSTFNMALHDSTGILRFYLYECTPGSVKCNNLASCEVKIRYVPDDSTIFWAIGPGSGVIAEHTEVCGKEVEMVVPFEGVNSGELIIRLMLKEWQFSDGSHSLNHFPLKSEQSLSGSSNLLTRTGRRFKITVVEGKDLAAKDKSGKLNPYVKLQYGKAVQRTSTAHTSNPAWNQKFEFDEIGGDEYLKIKCLGEGIFADDSIGNARVCLEGLVEGSFRDVWVPLEKVNSGDLRLQMESVRFDDPEGSRGSTKGSEDGWIELVLIEARDLRAADLRGTSDPYVRVHYGNLKKSTKVVYKTLNPQWHQTLEFPDDGSSLVLHVKDHNALLPTSSIGDCVVEYQGLPPNLLADKWIPLQGVKTGEIHIQIMRRVPEPEKRKTLHSDASLTKAHQASIQMKQKMIKFESLIKDGNHEALLTALHELETLEDSQQKYMVQLETEQVLLLNKIKELGQEILDSSSSPTSRRPSGP